MGASRLARVMSRYRSTYIREDGLRFKGEMLAPGAMENPNRVELARRFLKVPINTAVRPGDVFRTEGGQYFLILENGDSDFNTTVYKLYKLVEVDRKLHWRRTTKIIDPITDLEIDGPMQDMGAVWASQEEGGQRIDSLNLAQRVYRIHSPSPLKIGDMIGNLTVIEVFYVSGVTIADAK